MAGQEVAIKRFESKFKDDYTRAIARIETKV
jgi:hypothetical protein